MPSGMNDGARTAAVTTTDLDGAAVATIAGVLRPLLAEVFVLYLKRV